MIAWWWPQRESFFKRPAAAVLVVVMILSGPVFGQKRLEKFVNDKHRVSLYYSPDVWNFQLQTSPRSDLAVFTAKGDSEAVAVLNMFDRVPGFTLTPRQLYEMDKASLQSIFGGMEILDERTLTLGGASAHLVVFDGKEKRVIRYTIVHQGYVYLLGYFAPKEKHATYLSDFKTMVDTFAIDGLTTRVPVAPVDPAVSAPPAPSTALEISTRPRKVFLEQIGDSVTWHYHLIIKNPTSAEVELQGALLKLLSGAQVVEDVKLDAEMLRQSVRTETTHIPPGGEIVLLNNAERRPAGLRVDRVEYALQFRLAGDRLYQQVISIPLLSYRQKTSLMLPFNGTWRVVQGHDIFEGHRQAADGQAFAYDFVYEVEGRDRRPAVGSSGKPALHDFYAYGRKVRAPADGRVVRAVDGEEDGPPMLTRPPFVTPPANNPYKILGNYVVLDHGNGEYSLLAHLKKGSLTFKVGDLVKKGQILGECGNSGNSTQPHIHYQLMDGPDHFKSLGLPVRFSRYRSRLNDREGEVAVGAPVVRELVENLVPPAPPKPPSRLRKVPRRKAPLRSAPPRRPTRRR